MPPPDRFELLARLREYVARHPDERPTAARIGRLLETRADCFERHCFAPGHVTASAWIVSRESGAALLTHHRKLGRWLQLGGHTDGEADVLATAVREAEEESGLRGFAPLPRGAATILDIDVHAIPARGDEPEHEHHDIRFLLEVSEAQPIRRQQSESADMRWFAGEALSARLDEESLARMARKASAWLARTPPGPARPLRTVLGDPAPGAGGSFPAG